jgi:hypothetical protein
MPSLDDAMASSANLSYITARQPFRILDVCGGAVLERQLCLLAMLPNTLWEMRSWW